MVQEDVSGFLYVAFIMFHPVLYLCTLLLLSGYRTVSCWPRGIGTFLKVYFVLFRLFPVVQKHINVLILFKIISKFNAQYEIVLLVQCIIRRSFNG